MIKEQFIADLKKNAKENDSVVDWPFVMAHEKDFYINWLEQQYRSHSEIPKYESVSEWEARTGEKYPDDGPVWALHQCTSIGGYIVKGEPKRWYLYTYDARRETDKRGEKINVEFIVATHHGKPPADVQGGE